jgi:hypothetical protein
MTYGIEMLKFRNRKYLSSSLSHEKKKHATAAVADEVPFAKMLRVPAFVRVSVHLVTCWM